VGDVPTEDGLAVDLVDVLAAWAGASGERELDFLERDLNFLSGFQFNDQHGMTSLWASTTKVTVKTRA
jgi:hypothetical protein